MSKGRQKTGNLLDDILASKQTPKAAKTTKPTPAPKKTTQANASKKRAAASKQTAPAVQAGKAAAPKSVSYRIGADLQARVGTVAEQNQVGKSDLVRYLLQRGLDQIETGELTLQRQPHIQKYKIAE